MSLLVFGQTGQIALALQRQAPHATALGREAADLFDPAACVAAIAAHRPTAVINAAAYTAVDRAETEEALATVINGAAPAAMAKACAELDIPFVHISTDYVFAGRGDAPFAPGDPVAPLGAYGRSKLVGEQGVQAAGGVYGILRTSWVFSADGANFVKTMLRLAETRDHLTVVGDQVGGPTPADAIAAACLAMVDTLGTDPSRSGIYHFAGTPDTSWSEFARAIFEIAGKAVHVEDVTTEAYGAPAPRPRNSRLDCTATQAAFGIERPDWRHAVAAIVAQNTAQTA